MASRPGMHPESELGIPDLIRRLTEDSKRLARDEVRLAKMEMRESVKTSARGAVWLALAFGAGVVALVALTIMLSALIGRLLGNYWAGTLITAALDLGLGFFLVKRGLKAVTEPSYTFEESRDVDETRGSGRPGGRDVALALRPGRGGGRRPAACPSELRQSEMRGPDLRRRARPRHRPPAETAQAERRPGDVLRRRRPGPRPSRPFRP